MEKIKLTGVPETLLIPFYARVYGSLHYKNKFYDSEVLKVKENIEYDFSKFEKGKMSIWGTLSRSIFIDKEVKNFLIEHPNASCITIGCGFDTRFERVDNGKLRWYGIDFADVIALRKKLFPSKGRNYWISGNALDISWTKEIEEKEGENILIILEGILMYFEEKEIQTLFAILQEAFPGAMILAEFMRPSSVRYQKYHDTIGKTTAIFKWGIKHSKDIEKLCPRIQYIEEYNLTKGMFQFSPLQIALFSPMLYPMNDTIVKLKCKK